MAVDITELDSLTFNRLDVDPDVENMDFILLDNLTDDIELIDEIDEVDKTSNTNEFCIHRGNDDKYLCTVFSYYEYVQSRFYLKI